MERKFRYIEEGHGDASLSPQDIRDCRFYYDLDLKGFYVLAPLTKTEWLNIVARSEV